MSAAATIYPEFHYYESLEDPSGENLVEAVLAGKRDTLYDKSLNPPSLRSVA